MMNACIHVCRRIFQAWAKTGENKNRLNTTMYVIHVRTTYLHTESSMLLIQYETKLDLKKRIRRKMYQRNGLIHFSKLESVTYVTPIKSLD